MVTVFGLIIPMKIFFVTEYEVEHSTLPSFSPLSLLSGTCHQCSPGPSWITYCRLHFLSNRYWGVWSPQWEETVKALLMNEVCRRPHSLAPPGQAAHSRDPLLVWSFFLTRSCHLAHHSLPVRASRAPVALTWRADPPPPFLPVPPQLPVSCLWKQRTTLAAGRQSSATLCSPSLSYTGYLRGNDTSCQGWRKVDSGSQAWLPRPWVINFNYQSYLGIVISDDVDVTTPLNFTPQ